ncbi:MAG: dihydrolipoyllysine-residue succinyltransferase [Bdellovibrionota bacterium]
MKHEILAPSVGESITEVSILKWHKSDGQMVKLGETILEIESDKATVEIAAEYAGVISIKKPVGERVNIGEVVAVIDDEGVEREVPQPANTDTTANMADTAPAKPAAAAAVKPLSPAIRRIVSETGIDVNGVKGSGPGGRITKADLLNKTAGERRVPMSIVRMRIAERLLHAQHSAAILTTFNEADMSDIIAIRNKYKEEFKATHGVSLGYMTFFTLACIEALKAIPEVNASIDGTDMVYHDYYNMGIAVGTDRGLVVPVLHDAGKMTFPEIEKKIAELAVRARDNKLSIADLSGGTFTISNGGVYGSLLSTPILNPPQSAILGMHKIQDRPVAVNGKVEIRPMMYLALSYDHRMIDGKGAVTFLVTLKDFIEHPEKLRLELK